MALSGCLLVPLVSSGSNCLSLRLSLALTGSTLSLSGSLWLSVTFFYFSVTCTVSCKVSSISRSCWAYSVVERWEFCLHNVVLLHYLGIKEALINKIQPRLWCTSNRLQEGFTHLATCTCVAFVLFFSTFSFKSTSLQTFLAASNQKGRHGSAMSSSG